MLIAAAGVAYAGDRYEILNEIDRLSAVGAHNDKCEQISRKLFGYLTGLAMSILNGTHIIFKVGKIAIAHRKARKPQLEGPTPDILTN